MIGKKIVRSTMCLLLASLWLVLPVGADDKGKDKDKGEKKSAAAATPAATRSAVTTQPAPAAGTRGAPAATPPAAKPPETALDRISALVAERKAVLTRRSAALAGAGKHLREADKAHKRHAGIVKAKKPGKETPADVIAVANTEDAAANAQATEAEQASAQADAIDAQLDGLVKAAEARLANAKTAAEAAQAAADAAKQAAKDAKKAELDAKKELNRAMVSAGLGTPAAREARRKKSADEIAKVKAKVQASGAATGELAKAPAPAAAAPAAAAPAAAAPRGKPAGTPGKPAAAQ